MPFLAWDDPKEAVEAEEPLDGGQRRPGGVLGVLGAAGGAADATAAAAALAAVGVSLAASVGGARPPSAPASTSTGEAASEDLAQETHDVLSLHKS